MLTKPQLLRFSSSARIGDATLAEKDIVLTYFLQLLAERGFLERVAFKGGTCIRKMLLGNRGRFSTDLDFTTRAPIDDPDGAIVDFAQLIADPYHGIQFDLDLSDEKSWRSQQGQTVAVHPTYKHALGSGFIKFEISLRETPMLPLVRYE